MTSKSAAKIFPPAKNLKRSFECAVRDVCEAGASGKVSPYRTPIVQRAGTITSTSIPDVKKRALSDAARALAQLWKISPKSSH